LVIFHQSSRGCCASGCFSQNSRNGLLLMICNAVEHLRSLCSLIESAEVKHRGGRTRRAEAKTLVMSLWKAPDAQTRELMEDFYRRILAGGPRAEALRQAQLEMKKRYPDPFYWGAFICQGDPSPLP